MNINKINPLNPFGRMCVSLGMLPSSYKESMTYEEQLLWLFNYLDKTLIPKINEQDETINGVIDLFNQLKEYVDNYFENLDVQDEINHKLDEMVEDGTFDVIFAQVDAKIGDLSSLTTTDTSSIVSAVNEIDSNTDNNTSTIGDLSSLTTTSKTNLVSAINEVDGNCDTNTSNISTNASAIGTLSNLSTTEKSNLVGAINEVYSKNTMVFVPFTINLSIGDQMVVKNVNYPSGFTKTNCVVINAYYGQTTLDYEDTHIHNISLKDDHIEVIYDNNTQASSSDSYNYTLLLMKK